MTVLERPEDREICGAVIRVLVVDDDVVLVRALQRVLELQGFRVDMAFDGRTALSRLESNDYDVMLLDLRMGSMDGMEVYTTARGHFPPATIIHSAHIDVRTAVLATRAGVQEIMQKPVPEDVLAAHIRELAAKRRASQKPPQPTVAPPGSIAPAPANSLLSFVGSSPQTVALREQVRRVAKFRDVSVLVQGPTGTGKELVAQAVHMLTCPDEPFVSINCAAVPEQLFESELFGHEAGAFTSAKSARVGILEEAGRGTLFLDEVGEMPLGLQAKLLRVLEIRQFRRIGGTRTRVLSARIVSATNRPTGAGGIGNMRPDLFFRLAGYAIRTPSLLERISDVPALAEHFAARFAAHHALGGLKLSPSAVEVLMSHSWPGNVRELRAVIENASIIARAGVIGQDEVEIALQARGSLANSESESRVIPVAPSWMDSAAPESNVRLHVVPPAPSTAARRPPSLPDLQRDVILRAFEQSQQNLSKAASDLGIPRSTLRARLKRYGVR